jgi:hypothetical protein
MPPSQSCRLRTTKQPLGDTKAQTPLDHLHIVCKCTAPLLHVRLFSVVADDPIWG